MDPSDPSGESRETINAHAICRIIGTAAEVRTQIVALVPVLDAGSERHATLGSDDLAALALFPWEHDRELWCAATAPSDGREWTFVLSQDGER